VHVRGANAIPALLCRRLNRSFKDYWESLPSAEESPPVSSLIGMATARLAKTCRMERRRKRESPPYWILN
jgi:hypothetical protein